MNIARGSAEDAVAGEEQPGKDESMIWTQVFYGREVIAGILATISTKQALQARFHLRYVLRAAMAGVICALMYLFAYQVKTELGQDVSPALSHMCTAVAFSFALALIYFTHSELLTSNFMYFTVGLYYRKVRLRAAAAVLTSCLVGNLLGILAIGLLANSAGMLGADLVDNVIHTVQAKTTGSGAWQIFVRAIFANYFINISVIIAMQVKESLAKMVVLSIGVIVFAFMGYEHVIANSALFVFALLAAPESVNLLHIAKNFWVSLLGNYVGGGLVIGFFYAYLNDDRRRPSSTHA
jgi:formate/nitrite transporter FocA (FNT family)